MVCEATSFFVFLSFSDSCVDISQIVKDFHSELFVSISTDPVKRKKIAVDLQVVKWV